MKMELEKLHKLQAICRKIDHEQEQHRLDIERDATVIAELKRGKEEPLNAEMSGW